MRRIDKILNGIPKEQPLKENEYINKTDGFIYCCIMKTPR